MLFLLSLLITAPSFAAPATCTTYETDRNGKEVPAVTEINYEQGYLLRNGVKAPVLQDSKVPVTGAAAFAADWNACESVSSEPTDRGISAQRECMSAVMEKHLRNADDEFGPQAAVKLGLVFHMIFAQSGQLKSNMDISRVASARLLQLDSANKFGIPGLYEYFDASGALLGRLLINTPLILECR